MFDRHRRLQFASALLVLSTLIGCGEAPAPPAPAPPEVVVAKPLVADVTVHTVFTGTTSPSMEVDVEARVFGELQERNFEDGALVTEGDVLFVIEKEPYIAALQQSQAGVRSAKAELERASSDLRRIEEAIETNSVSRQDLDLAQANRLKAMAAVASAEAAVVSAELNLSYTDLEAPISGRISRGLVDTGNLVGAGGTTHLATIRQIQPLQVYFEVPETQVLTFLKEFGIERFQEAGERVWKIRVGSSSDDAFPHAGTVDYIDTTADPGTGTITVRAVLANEDLHLLPGVFVRVQIPGQEIEDATLVHGRALGRDLGGQYVFVVGADNMVERRYVTLGPPQPDGTVVVLEGLTPAETYILDGVIKARPGLPVTPRSQADAAEAN